LPHRIAIDARKVQDFGIGTYIRQLIRSLAELDSENHYLLLTRGSGRDLLDELPENFELVTERSPVYSLRELVALSWRLFRLDLDLYHATHYVLPLVVPSKVVVTIHDIIHLLYPEFLPHRLAFLYAQRMLRRSLQRGDRILAVSRNTKLDLVEYFGIDGGKIQVIYNGVDDVFRQQLSEEKISRWMGNLGIERPYILFVGNPAKAHKNLDRVVQAFARAHQIADFDAPLVCVGDRGNAAFKIRQRAAHLGVEERVILLGHVAEEALPAIYQGASLFLYPTLYEGFGLPVVEAMASGVPVVTSHGSALKEIAEGYAHLVDPLDVQALAEAIAHCMKDEEHRQALAKLGRRRAEDFHWKRTAERTLAAYRSVLGSAEETAGERDGKKTGKKPGGTAEKKPSATAREAPAETPGRGRTREG
jgi:glycosyltransferase involved in cell wall biosynthesis